MIKVSVWLKAEKVLHQQMPPCCSCGKGTSSIAGDIISCWLQFLAAPQSQDICGCPLDGMSTQLMRANKAAPAGSGDISWGRVTSAAAE